MSILKTLGTVAVASALMFGLQGAAFADEKAKNLKVLEDTGKELGKGMKAFSKGLGVECKACHVKGEFDSDKIAEKENARKFFEATVGEKDQAKKDAALKDLLAALRLKDAKNPASVWEAVGAFKKKGG